MRALTSQTTRATSASSSAVCTTTVTDMPSVRARLVILLHVGWRTPRSIPHQ
jgi:hypothetical protein